ncbi:MAG: hypothetical protein PVF87_02255 [Acidimicrobiia bacterium]
MITEDQGLLMLRKANPVPETETEDQVVDVRLHQAIEQRSSEVTQLSTQEKETPKRNRTSMAWLAAAAVVILVGAAIIFFNQGAEEPPPATDVVPTTVAPPTTTPLPSTTDGEEDTERLAGEWMNSDGTTIIFNDDATFTFEFGSITSAGTYETDAEELTFTFTENSNDGCVGATITWEYQLDGDSMTAETTGDECTNAVGARWNFSRTQP